MALPEPEHGLVISYSYLWRHESEKGQTEGRKNRPCVIVSITTHDHQKRIIVAPITHTIPHDDSAALEIPPKVKRYLRLDGERSWIILDDFNEFLWPGYDLRPVPENPARYDCGLVPPLLFEHIKNRMLELRREGRIFVQSRDATL